MTLRRPTRCAGALLSAGLLTAAGAGAQQRPAVRALGPALATSEGFVALSAVRQLPGGRVLVNDPGSHRVLLLDSALKIVKVVADSTASTANAYGARPGGLIAYRGDSTLFVDPSSLSMLVIDPAGTINRIMAAPRPNDVAFLTGGPFGNPGLDAQGRLIYRTLNRPGGGGAPPTPQPGKSTTIVTPDSTPLIRFDFATRKLDTALFMKIAPIRMNMVQNERGMSMSSIMNPMPVVDDWAVLPDGSIALLRGKDYHLDVFAPDGARSSGEKIPFDWQRLADDDKTRVLDSARTAFEAARTRGNTVQLGGGPGGAAAPAPAAGGGEGPRMVVMTMTTDGPGGPTTTMGAPPANFTPPPMLFVEPGELPDYRPAFAGGAMRADADGRLWVRIIPPRPLAGGPEYDVLDRTGKLVERVAIPKGSTIVGFGSGGIVYLGVRDAAGTHLVRARAR
jgi:hypothetical protein